MSSILKDHKHRVSTGCFCEKTMVPAFWRIHLWTLWCINVHKFKSFVEFVELSENDAKYNWMVAGKLIIIPVTDGSEHSIKHHETISILPAINFDASSNTFPLMLGHSPPSVPSPPQPFSCHSLTRDNVAPGGDPHWPGYWTKPRSHTGKSPVTELIFVCFWNRSSLNVKWPLDA
jgi:hypothetical protein